MPRYYFHVTDQNGVFIRDDEGEAFDHAAEAEQNARLVVAELERQSILRGGGRSITVTGEDGAVVFELSI